MKLKETYFSFGGAVMNLLFLYINLRLINIHKLTKSQNHT